MHPLCASLLLAVVVATSGCSHINNQGACVITPLPKPVVTLESITAAPDSPGRGMTLFPFPRPVYPQNMLLAYISGEVVVRVAVNPDGKVQQTSVLKTSMPEFAAPAVAAAQSWRFIEFREPGLPPRQGMILDCTIKFAVSLDDDLPFF